MTLFLPLASSMKRSEECPYVKSVGVVDEMMREAYSPPFSLFNPHRYYICLHVSLSPVPTHSQICLCKYWFIYAISCLTKILHEKSDIALLFIS
jgi:hypothetical protein